jgi:hypothetical protein
VSRALFELGARLRAAHTGHPVPVAVYAPVLPPTGALAVSVDHDGEQVYVNATDGTTTLAGTDRDGLAALATLGAVLGTTHRTLVVATRRDVVTLAALARAFPDEPAAPVVGWWDQRVDHPGTGAVHPVVATARLRWVLGVHPDRERELDIWRTWLAVTTSGPQALLDLARLTASGSTLPGLLEANGADSAAWERYTQRLSAGRPWWSRDTRADAALGLASRSHAVEWFESLRLDDPLVARAAAHDGTVVAGRVVAVDKASVAVEADRPLSRLRVDAKVTAWPGEPTKAGGPECIGGRVLTATVGADARLTITVGDLVRRLKDLAIGDRVTLRPARVDPFMQANGRGLMAAGYFRGTNWIAGRGQPMARRGDVPLDVIVAAAGD